MLGAGQHLVIFASGKNLTGGELHTNFNLSRDGEDLALVMPDGTTIADSYLAFPPQLTDVSFGIGASTSSTANVTLVGAGSTVKVISPTGEDAAVDDHWQEIGFNDAGWLPGTRSVGFDRNSDGIALAPFIGTVLTTGQMSNTATHGLRPLSVQRGGQGPVHVAVDGFAVRRWIHRLSQWPGNAAREFRRGFRAAAAAMGFVRRQSTAELDR